MQIYTSRYDNGSLAVRGDIAPIGISLYRPRWRLPYALAGSVRALAPSKSLWGLDEYQYIIRYIDALNRLDILDLRKQIETLAAGKHACLLCYEDLTEEWCHRRMFAEWWEVKTGEKITEL